jgi:hypothetical protein
MDGEIRYGCRNVYKERFNMRNMLACMLTYIWQTINDVTAMGEDRTTQGGCGSIIMCTHSGGRSTARIRASHSRRGS